MQVRLGQEALSSAHFISFDGKKAYRIYCSCDAFILVTADEDFKDEFREACREKDINKVLSLIRLAERYVKNVKDYQQFLEYLDELVANSDYDYEFINDLESEFEECEEVIQ